MAQYLGKIEGKAGPITRLGSKNSGLAATAASWSGAIHTELRHHKGHDEFRVVEIELPSKNVRQVLIDWRRFGA